MPDNEPLAENSGENLLRAVPWRHGFTFTLRLGADGWPEVRTSTGHEVRFYRLRKPPLASVERPWWGADNGGARQLARALLGEIFNEVQPLGDTTRRIASFAASDDAYIEAVARALLIPEHRAEFTLGADALLRLAPPGIEVAPPPARPEWPEPGDKMRYLGAHDHWFTDITENAKRELRVGEIYTLSYIYVASSWTAVRLAETGEHEYSLAFFERL